MMDEIKRMQYLAEIKVNNPININRVSLDTFKKALLTSWTNTVNELEFEQPEQAIEDFTTKVLSKTSKEEISDALYSFLDKYGFGEDTSSLMILRIFVI